MKGAILLLLQLTLISNCFSAVSRKVLTISESLSYPKILVNDSYLIIGDSFYNYRIYSITNGNLLSEFNVKGQGPGEFPFIFEQGISDNHFWLSGYSKLAYYNFSGKLEKEILFKKNISGCIPLGSKGYIQDKRLYNDGNIGFTLIDYNLLNINFQNQKKLLSTKVQSMFTINGNIKNIFLMRDCTRIRIDKDKIVIGSSFEGCNFWIFNENGDMLKKIDIPYEPILISNKSKNEFLDYECGPKVLKKIKEKTIKYTLRDHFPAFYNFYVDSEKIYILHYPINILSDKDQAITIIDFNGNIVLKSHITNVEWLNTDLYAHMVIFKDHFYYLQENDIDESWELYKQKIE